MVVQVKCRKCGNSAPADQFRVDYRAGYVVCPACLKGQSGKDEKRPIVPKISPLSPSSSETSAGSRKDLPETGPRKLRPAGWDEDDALADRLWKEKQQQKGQVIRVNDTLMRYTCGKCGYSFTFKQEKRPLTCPYCNTSLRA